MQKGPLLGGVAFLVIAAVVAGTLWGMRTQGHEEVSGTGYWIQDATRTRGNASAVLDFDQDGTRGSIQLGELFVQVSGGKGEKSAAGDVALRVYHGEAVATGNRTTSRMDVRITLWVGQGFANGHMSGTDLGGISFVVGDIDLVERHRDANMASRADYAWESHPVL